MHLLAGGLGDGGADAFEVFGLIAAKGTLADDSPIRLLSEPAAR